MLLILSLVGMFSMASAAPVRPSVTNVEGVQSVHVLLGTDGQAVASCVQEREGWACDEVDVDSPLDVHLLLDTKLFALGPTEIDGPFMNIEKTLEGGTISWKREVEAKDGHGDSLVVIRVIEANSKQAPMLRLRADSQNVEVGCADDGQFPDGIPNDGQFHCATVIRTKNIKSEQWKLVISMPMPNGEEESLGTFPYSGKTGLYFATVSVGGTAEPTSDAFTLVGPTVLVAEDDPDQAAIVEAPPPDEGEEKKPPVDNPTTGFKPSGDFSSVSLWLIGLSALGIGWWIGVLNRKRRFVLDEVRPLPVSALDGRGPVPEPGVVAISAASPIHTLTHVARSLTARRRVVLVGDTEGIDIESIHPVLQVTDTDQHAIQKLIKRLLSDGGVPPVLLVLGMDAVLDTGGASPSPTQDMLAQLDSVIWCAVFLPEDASMPNGFSSWGHDPQAGWSTL